MFHLFVVDGSNADSVAIAVAPSPAVPAPVGKVRPLHITVSKHAVLRTMTRCACAHWVYAAGRHLDACLELMSSASIVGRLHGGDAVIVNSSAALDSRNS